MGANNFKFPFEFNKVGPNHLGNQSDQQNGSQRPETADDRAQRPQGCDQRDAEVQEGPREPEDLRW